MKMEFVTTTLLVTTLPPIIYFFYILIRNQIKNQYFQKNLPQLPILDGQKPLVGHMHITSHPRNWKIFEDGHKKLGKFLGYYLGDKRHLSTIDLDFIKRFAVDEDYHDRFYNLDIPVEEMETDCIFTARGEQWRRLRKAMAPAFSKHKVMSPNVLADIDSVINKFVDSIESRLNKALKERSSNWIVEDVDRYLQRYALALVFTCFYKQDGAIDFYSETDEWQTITDEATSLMVNPFTLIPQLFPPVITAMRVILKIYHPLGKLQSKVREFVRQQLELYKRAKLESKTKDNFHEANFRLKDGTIFRSNMVDHFIGNYIDKKITEREFYHSSFLLFMAASKTSSDALSRLIYLLACNQDAQDKLRESIRSEKVESVYLKWVINETLRLFPPAHIGCTRTLTQDIRSKFGVIPKDTLLSTNAWTIHRWPEYWGQDANEFKPDRWSEANKFHPLQFIPFGAGRRRCPGKEFAFREMQMLVVKLLLLYKFERSDKTTDELEFRAPFNIQTVFEVPTWVKIIRLEATDTIQDALK